MPLSHGTGEELRARAQKRRFAKLRGHVEGDNLVLEHQSAEGDASRFPGLISELITLNVNLIFARRAAPPRQWPQRTRRARSGSLRRSANRCSLQQVLLGRGLRRRPASPSRSSENPPTRIGDRGGRSLGNRLAQVFLTLFHLPEGIEHDRSISGAATRGTEPASCLRPWAKTQET
jgi:hypothetical protein